MPAPTWRASVRRAVQDRRVAGSSTAARSGPPTRHHCHYMIALVRIVGRAGRPAEGPVAVHRRPLAAGRHGAADPSTSPATPTSTKCSSTTCMLADDALIGQRGQRLGPGQCRARLRAQRAGAHLLQHRAAGALDRLAAPQRRGASALRDHRPAGHAPGHAAPHVDRGHHQAGGRRKPDRRGSAGQGHRHQLRAGDPDLDRKPLSRPTPSPISTPTCCHGRLPEPRWRPPSRCAAAPAKSCAA